MNKRILDIGMAVCLLAGVATAVIAGLHNNNTKAAAADTKEGYVIVIDPGHGGSDPGKVGCNNILEKDINLAISNELKSCLEEQGIKVIMTRTDDAGLYSEEDSNKKAADMRERCRIIEENAADIVVSIHQNSYTDSSVAGAQVFYYKHSKSGAELAQIIQDSLKNNVNPDNNRLIKANDSYYMLIHTKCPTVIVECGFLSNPGEAEKLSEEDYQKQIAEAISDGIKEYLQ